MRASTGAGSLRVTTTLDLRSAMWGHEKGRVSARPTSVCSKAGHAGQWLAHVAAAFVLLAAVSLGAAACSRHAASASAPAGRSTPSGLPIPRYVSLKFGKVNARGGPGDDYKLLWVYRVKGLPLQVVAETQDWRRVCDPDGQVSWVHRRTVAERRTVMRTDTHDLALRRSPDEASPATASLVGRALADLKVCRPGGWCQIVAGHAAGWVRAEEVWGVDERVQCRSD